MQISGVAIATEAMTGARVNHAVARTTMGLILICGGQYANGNVLATAELYSESTGQCIATCEYFYPVAGKFAAVAGLTAARAGHRAELLHNGLLLVAGGANSGNPALALTELYVLATAAEMGIAPF